MTTYKLAISGDKKKIFIGKDTVTFPNVGGAPVSLGTFVHDHSTDPVHAHAGNHTLWHHIRDILYKKKWENPAQAATHPEGIYNMQSLDIVRYGGAILATWLSAAPVGRAGAGTITPVVKYRYDGDAGGVNAALTDFTWVSSDPTKATVNAATGVITYVDAGTTTITGTEVNGTKTISFVATLT